MNNLFWMTYFHSIDNYLFMNRERIDEVLNELQWVAYIAISVYKYIFLMENNLYNKLHNTYVGTWCGNTP